MKLKTIASAFIALLSIGCLGSSVKAAVPVGVGNNGVAYFSFVASHKTSLLPHEFVFAVTDPVLADKIRDIIGSDRPLTSEVHIEGKIALGRESYNEEWPFHFVPETLELFESEYEVCDADTFEVEDHLAEVGGSFLPNNKWCPFDSRLIREVAWPG